MFDCLGATPEKISKAFKKSGEKRELGKKNLKAYNKKLRGFCGFRVPHTCTPTHTLPQTSNLEACRRRPWAVGPRGLGAQWVCLAGQRGCLPGQTAAREVVCPVRQSLSQHIN